MDSLTENLNIYFHSSKDKEHNSSLQIPNDTGLFNVSDKNHKVKYTDTKTTGGNFSL